MLDKAKSAETPTDVSMTMLTQRNFASKDASTPPSLPRRADLYTISRMVRSRCARSVPHLSQPIGSTWRRKIRFENFLQHFHRQEKQKFVGTPLTSRELRGVPIFFFFLLRSFSISLFRRMSQSPTVYQAYQAPEGRAFPSLIDGVV